MAISGVTPQIRTTDLDASIDFYVTKLGFTLGFRYGDFYAGVRIGERSMIHLKLVDSADPSIDFVADGGHLHLYFDSDDVDADARRLKGHGVVLREEVTDTAWGTREFSVVDDQGHVLCFGQESRRPEAE